MDIVIVDDQPSARTMLRNIVQGIGRHLDVHDFGEARLALEWCDKNQPDLLLLDYHMAGMDGLAMARTFRRAMRNRDVPVMLVTAVGDESIRQAALDAGVVDVLVKPVRPRELRARCRNFLRLRQRLESAKQRASAVEERLLASLREIEARERETLWRLASVVELREAGVGARLGRMARVAGLIAEGLGLQEDHVDLIAQAAPLHDIGKIAISDSLLIKSDPLTEDERLELQKHVQIGYELLKESKNKFMQVAARIALYHHERYDGLGYPARLSGSDIPIEARIVAVAGEFVALVSPHRQGRASGVEDALELIERKSGKMLDPACVGALRGGVMRLREICEGDGRSSGTYGPAPTGSRWSKEKR